VLELSRLNGKTGFVIRGIAANDETGISIASAGDVNSDGIDDLIIGAHHAVANGQIQAGKAYIVFGGESVGASGSFALSSIDGSNGFALYGTETSDLCGISVASAGDVNGDGIGDVIVGAEGADPGTGDFAGKSYVVFGRNVGEDGPFPLAINSFQLDGSDGFVLNGVLAYESGGRPVCSPGDVNDDGFDDLIVSASLAGRNAQLRAGKCYVVFGGPAIGASGAIALSTLSGSTGFVVNGVNAEDLCGRSVSGAGDINGDGIDDVIIGAIRADPALRADAGKSYVVFGAAGIGASSSFSPSSLSGPNGFTLNGVDAGDYSGESVACAGDVNGDGHDDLVIGAIRADPNGDKSGETYVVFGGPGVGAAGSIDLSDLNGTNGFVLPGINPGDESGDWVSSAGDINGDGVDDVLIGTPLADPNGKNAAGQTYVVFGGQGIGASGSLSLAALDGRNGFVCNGIDPVDQSGWSVCLAGDLNHDGVDDIAIGAPHARDDAGDVYIVFGRHVRQPLFCPADINGDAAVNVADFNILVANFGRDGASAIDGDLNGDGSVDVSDFNILAAGFGCGP